VLTTTNYTWTGAFNQAAFQKSYENELKGVPKFNMASVPDLLFVLSKLCADSRISDLRWAACMLATVFVETSHTVKITKTTKSKDGRIKPHTLKQWRNFTPIEESGHGKGRKYEQPVKVKRLQSGDARITEWDGEQWVVLGATGQSIPRTQHPKEMVGVPHGTSCHVRYKEDDGDEQYYYGRGYVQLTWWTGYVEAGVVLGRGLAFLFDPSLVMDRAVSYEVMATGLHKGAIFAKHGFAYYSHGGRFDYVQARSMVNPGEEHAKKVAFGAIAERFERVLLASRVSSATALR
jgi:hypothetical protein